MERKEKQSFIHWKNTILYTQLWWNSVRAQHRQPGIYNNSCWSKKEEEVEPKLNIDWAEEAHHLIYEWLLADDRIKWNDVCPALRDDIDLTGYSRLTGKRLSWVVRRFLGGKFRSIQRVFANLNYRFVAKIYEARNVIPLEFKHIRLQLLIFLPSRTRLHWIALIQQQQQWGKRK